MGTARIGDRGITDAATTVAETTDMDSTGAATILAQASVVTDTTGTEATDMVDTAADTATASAVAMVVGTMATAVDTAEATTVVAATTVAVGTAGADYLRILLCQDLELISGDSLEFVPNQLFFIRSQPDSANDFNP